MIACEECAINGELEEVCETGIMCLLRKFFYWFFINAFFCLYCNVVCVEWKIKYKMR